LLAEALALLPTPIAQVAQRANVVGATKPLTQFMTISYLFEAALKLIGTALVAGVNELNPDAGHRLVHQLLEADGLGTWDQVIQACCSPPFSGYLPNDFRDVLRWLIQKRTGEDEKPFQRAWEDLQGALQNLGLQLTVAPKRFSVRDVLITLIQVRNKTRAHGALGEADYVKILIPFTTAVGLVVGTCPIFGWKWFSVSDAEDIEVVALTGNTPAAVAPKSMTMRSRQPGIYFAPTSTTKPILLPPLVISEPECRDFFFANGHLRENDASAEFISYASGDTKRVAIGQYAQSPIPLPKSETHGGESLDVQSNVFGNLPVLPRSYVNRPPLEVELRERLCDRNHSIITLHGRGGIGKTSLALYVAHDLGAQERPQFDQIVWISGRDIDLTLSGPKAVRQDVVSLSDIANKLCALFGLDPSIESLALILQVPLTSSENRGTLFIFDNFETLKNVTEIQKFLDTYTYFPNKVLITSRERAFKADFPIEVPGMEREEARQLAEQTARAVDIEPVITKNVFERIFEFTGGHPYLIKIMVGEMAKEGKFINPPQVIGRRDDIVDALFERSFNRLSEDAQIIFLAAANYNTIVPDFVLVAVFGQRGIDVQTAIDECVKQSLLESYMGNDDVRYIVAPQIARIFGRKKLRGDPNAMLIRADLEMLNRFGTINLQHASTLEWQDLVDEFFGRILSSAANDSREDLERVDETLRSIAEVWSYGWLTLARFRERHNIGRVLTAYAYRRAMEENPFDAQILRERANYARRTNDSLTELHCLIQLVELSPRDVGLLSEVAGKLTTFVNAKKDEIPLVSRSVYIASVRERMEQVSASLDSTGLSRLAWLFMLDGHTTEAERYAREGYRLDPTNIHCRRLLERLGVR
jgi:hypothetical protein